MSGEYLTQEQVMEYRDVFNVYDKNGDETISTSELYEVMHSLGRHPTQQQVEAMISEVDLNKNGLIDFDEFLILMAKDGLREAEERATFTQFDKDGDGLVDAEELRSVLSALGERLKPDEIEQMIKEADLDGDGRVNLQEFLKMIGGA